MNGQTVIQTAVVFTKGNLSMNITVDSSGQLTGLSLTPAAAPAVEQELPEGLTEEPVVVGEDTAHPLKGILTLPEHSSGRLPSVVLVHGSGSTDLDETAFAYKPFRDIAWGLAQQGIAVLRYDKRSYAYAKEFIGDASASLTLKEETVDDAILAARLLKLDKRLDPGHVYLAGHSLGGMLAPRIDADGGDFAGLILLAGSPRKLWEIVYDQNMNAINALDDSNPLKAQTVSAIDGELMKAKALSSLTAEQAKQAPAVFGISAFYLQEMQQHDTAELARKLAKPVLVMQGADDFQIFAGTDFPLWKEVLKNNAAAEFKLYPGLNHFFVNYDGAGAGTTAEYNVPGTVDPQVITDIGTWINAQYVH
ncbi:Alpha/beta hydrolase family protein [compost metagenome]